MTFKYMQKNMLNIIFFNALSLFIVIPDKEIKLKETVKRKK